MKWEAQITLTVEADSQDDAEQEIDMAIDTGDFENVFYTIHEKQEA